MTDHSIGQTIRRGLLGQGLVNFVSIVGVFSVGLQCNECKDLYDMSDIYTA